jgi:hypothetical protein
MEAVFLAEAVNWLADDSECLAVSKKKGPGVFNDKESLQ